MKSVLSPLLASVVACGALTAACWSGFSWDQQPPASGPYVPPPNICDAGDGGRCCGSIACSEACCLVGANFECLSDAGSCNGVLFTGTQCLSNHDCRGWGSCCLEWFGEPGFDGSGPATTTCEITSYFGCGLLETAVCTGDDAACVDGRKCLPVIPDGAPISACF